MYGCPVLSGTLLFSIRTCSMSYYSSSAVLGIMRGPDALYAVLMEETEEGPVVRFSIPPVLISRQESETDSPSSGEILDTDETPSDVTIEFEDEEDGSGAEESDVDGDVFKNTGSTHFLTALDAVLEECADRGYENPEIAFCAPYGEFDNVELQIPASAVDEDDESYLPLRRPALLDLFEKQFGGFGRQHDGTMDADRVEFLPMSSGGDGQARVLAIVSPRSGSIPSTIDKMPEDNLLQSPSYLFSSSPVQLRETEVSIYLAWVRAILGADLDPTEKSLIVRVGTEDTLLLFMEGNALHQIDTLSSLTTSDSADTICSRVLLYQDEYGMGDVDCIFLIGEDNEEGLVDGFQPYFSKTDIQLLRDKIPYGGEENRSGLYVAAIGAALREFEESAQLFDVPAMDFMGRGGGMSWSVPSVETFEGLFFLAIFLITGAALVWYGLNNAREIRERRAQLQSLESQTPSITKEQLQSQVDSLQSIVDRHARTREVRKQLLRGSDKWSRSLVKLANGVDNVRGLSVRQWTPQGAESVKLNGHAANRSRIIDLAEEIDAKIEKMTATKIREWSLYKYEMTMPLEITEPAAVQYWQREQEATADRKGAIRETEDDAPTSVPTESGGVAQSGGVAAGRGPRFPRVPQPEYRFGVESDAFRPQGVVSRAVLPLSASLAVARSLGGAREHPRAAPQSPVRD